MFRVASYSKFFRFLFILLCLGLFVYLIRSFPQRFQKKEVTAYPATIVLDNNIKFEAALISENELYYYIEWKGKKVRFEKKVVKHLVLHEKVEDIAKPEEDVSSDEDNSLTEQQLADNAETDGESASEDVDDTPRSKDITIFLKRGGTVSGELVSQKDESYVVKWQGGTVSFDRNEIQSVEFDDESIHDGKPGAVRLYLKNGGTVYGNVVRWAKDVIVINWAGAVVEFRKREIDYVDENPSAKIYSNVSLTLNSGELIYGMLIKKSDAGFLMNVDGVPIFYSHDNVSSVDWSDDNAPKRVSLYLVDDDRLKGEFLGKKNGKVMLRWQGVVIEVDEARIEKMDEIKMPKKTGQVTLHLAKGGEISGEILSADEKRYVLSWQGGITEFLAKEVSGIDVS